jgi:hypothetical protein
VTVSFRICLSVALAALAVTAASASAANHAAAGVSPGLVHRGQKVTFSFTTPAKAKSCYVSMTFANGGHDRTSNQRPRNRRVVWVGTIASTAPLGQAQYVAYCDKKFLARGSFVIVDAKSTSTDTTPRVVVDKQGFSQRNQAYGTGSDLSYGLILHNLSTTEDAQNVYVIVNMVAANGELLGSKSLTVKLVPAGGTYALGDTFGLRTQVPVTSLELTVRVTAHSPKTAHPMPDVANVRLVPSQFDPGWLGEVDGELVNDTSPQTLGFTNISVVVFDSSGNPVGGGTGMSSASIPYGSRFVFLAQSGFSAIPLDKAASVVISLDPSNSAPL